MDYLPILKNVKVYIGPMTKNVVDAVIDFANEYKVYLGLIPSRRQIDYNTGYVNNWHTESFANYVKNKTSYVILERDHGGPEQGDKSDDGQKSFLNDAKHLDIVHVDVWKKHKDIKLAYLETANIIKQLYEKNENLLFEVGTEEAIHKLTTEDLDNFLNGLKSNIDSNMFLNIAYIVIQSGTRLLKTTNTGVYNQNRLKEMSNVAKSFGLYTKEHNGDYLAKSIIHDRFANGVDAINIAPEFGVMESDIILSLINHNERNTIFNECYNSNRWVKWVDSNYNPFNNIEEIIRITGHYVLSSIEVREILSRYPEIPKLVKQKVYSKLKSVLNLD